MKFDETDHKLMRLLQEDCKKTTKEYALSLGLSNTAVYERIKRLEKSNTINGYVALLNKELVNRSFTVFCHIKLVQHTKDNIQQFEKDVLKLTEVVECYHLSGDYDYLIKVHVKDMPAYREFMISKLTALHHIGSTQSSFSISEVKHTTAVPIL
ncbi:AsnC family transcriptional regulator [Maribacter sp. 4U21]|uniref:Lrp/AsnC family transcriptional regulator n=1 Tax=Maribacter sp. 4U21 TaxID=1889779 RepID=UPI000C15AF75|nr:Lrp/AsnC family transcriptional regulator [Maribacter sp. 4U21]PIB25428.1 AsnC family transcriptional regulator [Maribacter sp. 4U21]